MNLFVTVIQHGYHSETKVLAILLKHSEGRYEPTVAFNNWSGSDQGCDSFEQHARVTVQQFDAHWRPNEDADRTLFARVLNAVRSYASAIHVTRMARRAKADVIYSSQQRYDIVVASVAARVLRIPHIVHLHYVPGPWLGRHVLRRLRSVDHVIAVSDFVRGHAIAQGVRPDRVTTIRNVMESLPPVSTEDVLAVRQELGLANDALVVGNISRVSHGKGQIDLINAFEAVAGSEPALRLVIVGDGDTLDEVRARAAGSEFTDRIRVTGHRSDIAQLLGSFDIFAHPSRMEPAGLAVLEASAAGLPVIAYDEGGISFSVENGTTGVLADPGNVESLTSALRTVIALGEARSEMGAAGRERISRYFRPRDVADEFAGLLTSVGKPGRGSSSSKSARNVDGEW